MRPPLTHVPSGQHSPVTEHDTAFHVLLLQAAQPAYMKTNSGRVLEVPKADEGPTTQQELEELSSTYQATVRLSSLDVIEI